MKKTIFGMIILIISCFMVTACKEKPPVHTVTDPWGWDDSAYTNPTPSVTTPDDGQQTVNIDNPEVQEKEDPLKMLEVSEDFAKEKKLLCLYRDDKLYSLGPRFISSDGKYVLPTGFDDGKDYVMNIDAPEIIIQEGDQIRDYGDEYVNVYKSTFTGYTIPMFEFNDGAVAFDDEVDPSSDGKPSVKGITGDITQVEVKDLNGGVVNNYRYLENSKSYKVSWYSGMDYREITMTANWKYYKIDSTPSYKLKGAVGQSGYALIDIRDIPSGTYHLGVRDTNTTLTGEEVFPITIP